MDKITIDNLAVYIALVNSLTMALGALLGWASKSIKEKRESERADKKSEVELAASYEQLASNAVTRLGELQDKVDALQDSVYAMDCKIVERERIIKALEKQIEELGGTPRFKLESLSEEERKR